MKTHFFCKAALPLLTLAVLGAVCSPLQAEVKVTNTLVRERVGAISGIGGVNIFAHAERFATNADGIPYQSDLAKADIDLVRTIAYPDRDRIGKAPLSTFDTNVSKIIAAGAKPLFVQYLFGWKPAEAPNPDLLKADGTKGGTIESNIIYLVKRYKAAPYNLATQYWEIGNEPDIIVDDYVANPADYTALFNSIHNALVAAGVRSNVVLCGPATSSDYGFNDQANLIMDRFLRDCKDNVDVVTRHIYNDLTTEDLILNDKLWNRDPWDHTSGAAGHGEYKLQLKMNELGVPSRVSTGVTEYNTIQFPHGIAQGLWNLKVLQYALYNPRMRLTTGFLFDDYGTQNDDYGFYDANKARDYNYWAHYINRKLRAFNVLTRSSTNAKLTVTGTSYPWKDEFYIEVINTDVDSAITDTVILEGPTGLRLNRVFQLSATKNTLESGEAASNAQSFSYTFPAKSVTIFRFGPATTTTTTQTTVPSGTAS